MNRWVAFEGIDGSGKTTLSTRFARALREEGAEVVHAREDGRFSSAISGRLRDLGRSEAFLRVDPRAELLLNLAREAQIVSEVVLPALRRGAWVITDRTTCSHVGLARHVRGLKGPEVEAAARLAAQEHRPGRVFLVDVDPDVARWRRRARKVLDRKLSESGRKGLIGDSLTWRMRGAYLEFAAAESWTVVDNTWKSIDENLRILRRCLDGESAPKEPERRIELEPGDLAGSYFRFVAGLEDPSLAALLAAGLDDPRADEIRRRAAPDLEAYAISEMDTAAAWARRGELRDSSPYYVARGLRGLGADPRAWELRRELDGRVPDQVLHGLSGEGTPEAHEVRARRYGSHPEESVRSTRGLDDSPSWDLRLRARRDGPSAALAESLANVPGPRAAELRSELHAAFPLAVLRGTRGVDHPDAWAWRLDLAEWAPKVVLSSIEGMQGPEAEELRARLRSLAPEETAASVSRVDTEAAWASREASADLAPVGTIKSLPRTDRGGRLLEEILRRHGGRLRVAREAVQFALGRE